jgi:exopolysaccharide production protein ExoZ
MKKIKFIQDLRGIAALLVLYTHTTNFVYKRLTLMGETRISDIDVSFSSFGDIGVDIFFIISGIVMAISLMSRKVTPIQFLKKRAIRILPIYYFYSAILMFSIIFVGKFSVDFEMLIYSLFFIPVNINDYVFLAFLGPGWTLNYEVFFYLLIAVALSLIKNLNNALLFVVILIFGFILGGYFLKPDPDSIVYFYTNSILIEFAIGLILGVILEKLNGKVASFKFGLLLSLLLITLIIKYFETDVVQLVPYRGFLYGSIACLFIMVYATFNKSWRFLYKIGEISYTLYLAHLAFVLQGTWKVLLYFKVETFLNFYLLVFLVMFIVVLISFPLYSLVEKRLNIYFNKYN